MKMKLVKSLLTMATISSLIALIVGHTVIAFIATFLVCNILQIILYNCWRQYVILKQRNQNLQKMEQLFEKIGVEVSCPCTKKVKQFIPVIAGKDNSYTCFECKKGVSVDIEVKTSQQTTPVALEEIDSKIIETYNQIIKETIKDE